jgi:hypothetical protein
MDDRSPGNDASSAGEEPSVREREIRVRLNDVRALTEREDVLLHVRRALRVLETDETRR